MVNSIADLLEQGGLAGLKSLNWPNTPSAKWREADFSTWTILDGYMGGILSRLQEIHSRRLPEGQA